MKYRSRTDIFASILESVNNMDGAGITTIMYKSFLSHYQLKKYMAIMLKNDLIRFEEERRIYKITDKGVRFLQLFIHMNELVGVNKDQWNKNRSILTLCIRFYQIVPTCHFGRPNCLSKLPFCYTEEIKNNAKMLILEECELPFLYLWARNITWCQTYENCKVMVFIHPWHGFRFHKFVLWCFPEIDIGLQNMTNTIIVWC